MLWLNGVRNMKYSVKVVGSSPTLSTFFYYTGLFGFDRYEFGKKQAVGIYLK